MTSDVIEKLPSRPNKADPRQLAAPLIIDHRQNRVVTARTDSATPVRVAEPDATAASGEADRLARPPVRVSFYQEQRRWRRATWRLSFVCLAIGMLLGVVLSAILSPIILALAGAVLKLAAWSGCHPDLCTYAMHGIGRWARQETLVFGWLVLHAPGSPAPAAFSVVLRQALTFCTVLLPGMFAMAIVWSALRVALDRGGMMDLVGAVGARAPRRDDGPEHRLTNISEELSLAAGIPAPRVMIIDTPLANVVAVGASEQAATVLVTRGLIELLNRDDTEAVVAHAIASIVNGDLIPIPGQTDLAIYGNDVMDLTSSGLRSI
jgi:Zn-dependent protease with chaperone function